ncbi:conserved hypothetical protein, secreted [Candidatus Magnetomorum sp. HK-1]|nr:conserved hypothetical protein, secreted [Candidatus Magnetomorum sp. HK-1]
MKKQIINKVYIFLLIAYFFVLFPINGWAGPKTMNGTIDISSQSCTAETTDILLHMRGFATKLLHESEKTRKFFYINQVYNAFVNEYEVLMPCHDLEIYQNVLIMLRKIDLKNMANVITAINIIDEALIKIYKDYSSPDEESIKYVPLESAYQKKNYQKNFKDKENRNEISLEDTIEDLSGIVHNMLNLSVRLSSDGHLKKERDLMVQEFNTSMRKCIKKGEASDNPVIEKITMQFTTIKINYPNQIIDTIHLLDHTLRVLSCLVISGSV